MPEIYAVDLDEELLSHLYDEEAWLTLRTEGFKAELIIDPDVREIFVWQAEHIKRTGKPATASALSEQFDIGFEEPELTIEHLVERMRERYMGSQMKKELNKLVEIYKDDKTRVPKEVVRLGSKFTSLLERKGETYTTGDGSRAIEAYEVEAARGKGPGLVGFEEIDNYVGGQRQMTILLGPPKGLKSWFQINGMYQNVICGKKTHYYSLELSSEEVDMRLRFLAASLPWDKYIHGTLTKADKQLLLEASDELDASGIFKIEKPPIGSRSPEELMQKAIDEGSEVVYIDQLQYLEHDGRPLGGWNKTDKFFDALNIAKEYSIKLPVFIAHQFNRDIRFSEDMPAVESSKSSNAPIEIATTVLGIWTNKKLRESQLVEVAVLRGRNVMPQKWGVRVNLEHQCQFDMYGILTDDDDE